MKIIPSCMLRCTRVLVVVGLVTSGGSAETLHVPAQYRAIQIAIDAASPGDVVLVAPGNYSEYEIRELPDGSQWASCAFLKDGVTVRSEGGPDVTAIDTSQIPPSMGGMGIIARSFQSTSTTVEGFALRGPTAKGVYVASCAGVVIRGCTFRDFSDITGGGAIVESNASFVDCEFTGCNALYGSAIWHTAGVMEVIGCSFRSCTGTAVATQEIEHQVPDKAFLLLDSCEFIDNSGDGSGAAQTSLAEVKVRNCMFKGNTSTGFGAGALGLGSGPGIVDQCVFIENRATLRKGGALRAVEATIRGCTFVNNHKVESSSDGSAISVESSVIENNIFYGGTGGAHVDYFGSSFASNCNVFWANPEGPGIPLSPTDREIDPMFCDVEALDLTLEQGSPCLPEDPLGCGLIGAKGLGCGAISVESSSWGSIKEFYRPLD